MKHEMVLSRMNRLFWVVTDGLDCTIVPPRNITLNCFEDKANNNQTLNSNDLLYVCLQCLDCLFDILVF